LNSKKGKPREQVISLSISIGSYKSFVEAIIEVSKLKESSYVCVANAHMTIEAYWDPHFAHVVNSADFVTPDGMPLVKALKLLYGIKQDRIAGMDLMPDLLIEAEKNELGVYFYGGSDEMLSKTKEYLEINYPKLKNHYFYSPPFRPLTIEEEQDVVNMINESAAHIVFVALGCPKQEKWMSSMKGKVNACMLGIGGALPVMIGMQKRAPMWMQKLSLEWVFRLYQEPKRLFKRYFVTNSLFLWLFLKEWISKKYDKLFNRSKIKLNK
jgi:N-acetylglucosaminyldiphosphoundecaprenol N-acetyl-beta-D-mannosaminyltransferase